MRVVRVREYGGPNVLESAESDVPKPSPGEVRIDVETIGVNFADISRRRGDSRSSQSPPFIPGLEAAGTIDSVSETVSRHEEGDRVVAFMSSGAYAEYALADANTVFELPDAVSFDNAAAVLIQFLTAHHSLHEKANITEGEDVLVHAAAGGVGSAAVQLASAAGATVYGTASTPAKRDWVEDLGATWAIKYTEESFVDEIAAATDERGVDVILDGVGGETLEESLEAIAMFGRIVSIGAASGTEGDPDPSLLRLKNVSLLGYHLSKMMSEKPDVVRSSLSDVFDHLVAGEITPSVTETQSLKDAKRVHERIESRDHHGKALLHP